MNDPELLSAVYRGETAVAEVGQSEIGLVGAGRGHIGHTEAHWAVAGSAP